jgi:hypothetical protein
MSYRLLAAISMIGCALFLGVTRAQAPSNESSQPEPRFQMITATVDGMADKNGHTSEEHTVFLLERNTGRIWKFSQAAFAFHKDGSLAGPALGAYFETVNVDGLHGWDAKQAVKEWIQQQKPDK